jgi:type VII secretion integral membrane protein EccD
MAQSSAGEVCRLLVIGPTSRVDLSVPTHVPLTDLMPAMLRSLGPDLADRGLEHSGWVLQRLGSPPLDEDLSVTEHGLLDGDTVHVRPRSDQIPPLDFDDLIDGVSTGISGRSGLWRSRTTRTVSVLALVVWLLVALLVPLFAGRPRAGGGTVSRATVVGAVAVLLYGAVWVASRLAADLVLAALVGIATVAFAAEAAALAVADGGAGRGPAGPSRPPTMLLAGAAVAVLAILAVLVVGFVRDTLLPVGLAVIVAALGAIVAGGLSSVAGLNWTRVAAVVALLCVAGRPSVPTTSFKLAGLALPPLPVEPKDLQEDIEPESGAELLARTARADRYMTALYTALGLGSSAALLRLALSPGWMPATFALLVGSAHLLAARPMTSTWHRLALGLPAAAAVVAVVLSLSARSGGDGGGGPVVPTVLALLLALGAAGCAHVLPRRRLTPIWGRLGDWGHTVVLAASVPLMVCLLGGVGLIRSVVG